jgi:hypothetical protein
LIFPIVSDSTRKPPAPLEDELALVDISRAVERKLALKESPVKDAAVEDAIDIRLKLLKGMNGTAAVRGRIRNTRRSI